jgi:sugar fermentation stimulation protein A
MCRPHAEPFRFFTNDREALFAARPNRFLILARDKDTEKEENLSCHCPNPGLLLEYLFPGERLILEKRRPVSPGAKTAWTAAGVYREGEVAPLFCARANRAAEQLLLAKGLIIPDIRDIRPEYTAGASRFDFLCVDRESRRHLVEVKACSLVERGVALFPDAPSARAVKHLTELERLSREGYHCHVLFLILRGSPDCFMPNIHVDPQFSSGLCRFAESAGATHIHASLIRCEPDGRAALVEPEVPVDLSHQVLVEEDRGSYLAVLEIPEARRVTVGALGALDFAAGWYVYAGSAQRNLSARVRRHTIRTRKKCRWHLDYLTPHAKTVIPLPIRAYRNLECDHARDLAALGARPIQRFGSSDCRCESHLFFFPSPPLENKAFVATLLSHRRSLRLF